MSINLDKPITAQSLQVLFEKSADVQIQTYTFQSRKVLFITCDSMIDDHLFNEVIIERVSTFLENLGDQPFTTAVKGNLHIPSLEKVNQKSEIIRRVYEGKVIIYFEDFHALYTSNIANKPNRKPEESKAELSVKGPRDNFIEDVSVNIALIRKRVPTNSLCVEKFELGKRTKTTVAVMYFDDIVNKTVLDGIIDKINKVDVDIVFSGDGLMELIDKRSSLFPRHDYTGRPDFAMQSLARGRVVILVDGVAYGVITPVNLFYLYKTAEDNEYPSIFSSFERLIRFSAILVGGLFPAFWLALISFHQDQLSIELLATVVKNSAGLPLPAVLEMLLMLITFELFREAGLRLPEAIGGTLSVVGGLIIGDAAIRAGITSPTMIVVIAVSVISSYTLLNQSLSVAVSIIRICVIIITACFGLFGFFMSFLAIVLYLANMRVFGVPYLNVGEDLRWQTIKKTFLRPAVGDYKERPVLLKTTDDTRVNEDKS